MLCRVKTGDANEQILARKTYMNSLLKDWVWWLMAIIPAMREAEVRRSQFKANLEKA
jgi:hypothetical protein